MSVSRAAQHGDRTAAATTTAGPFTSLIVAARTDAASSCSISGGESGLHDVLAKIDAATAAVRYADSSASSSPGVIFAMEIPVKP